MGIKDSKALNPKAPCRAFGEILNVIDSICIHKIDPIEVDDSVSLRGLNRLEAKVMANVINTIGSDEVYVDCCDVNPQRYSRIHGMPSYMQAKVTLYAPCRRN